MRVVPILFTVIVTGCARDKGGDGADAPRGKVVSSTEYKFEAWFPDAPTDKDSPPLKQINLLVPEHKGMYMLSARRFDHRVDLANTGTIDLFMAGARIGLLAGPNKGGKIISDEKYQFDGKYPAAKIDVESPKLGIYRVRLIHTETHFYQAIVAGPKDFVDSPDAMKFLDSLKLID